MKKDQSLHDYVVGDLMRGMPGIRSRAMFGGWGLYKGGTVFGIIADGGLYFKVGEANRGDYEERGCQPFLYESRGKKVAMSYWSVPEEVMENRQEMSRWIDRSVKVSLAAKGKPKRRK